MEEATLSIPPATPERRVRRLRLNLGVLSFRLPASTIYHRLPSGTTSKTTTPGVVQLLLLPHRRRHRRAVWEIRPSGPKTRRLRRRDKRGTTTATTKARTCCVARHRSCLKEKRGRRLVSTTATPPTISLPRLLLPQRTRPRRGSPAPTRSEASCPPREITRPRQTTSATTTTATTSALGSSA